MAGGWTRRALLRAAGGAALVPGLPAQATAKATEAGAPKYAELRARWRTLLLGDGFDRKAEPYRSRLTELGRAAAGHRARMTPERGALWRGLGYAGSDELPHVSSGHLYESFTRLRVMAEAYAQPGTGVTGQTELGRAVLAGLDHLLADVYHPGTTAYGNWWHWRIGGPQALLDTAVLMSGRLTERRADACCAAVDAFVPESAVARYEGNSTGANRVDLCRVLALRGVLGGEGARIQLARNALAPVFVPVTSGDGFHADGSFLQHSCVPHVGGYGAVLLGGLGMLAALLRGSDWDLNGPELRAFLGVVERAVPPFVYNGLVMDNVAGRGISRGGSPGRPDDHRRAHGLLASMALLADAMDDASGDASGDAAGDAGGKERAERWRAMVKGWLERGRPVADNRSLGIARVARLRAVAAAKVQAAAEPVEHRLFPGMDRATHRRPGWAASVSMASRQVAHYEYGNGENARGWHTGAGWLSWWGDGFGEEQYADAFWATADPYRLPGVTVSTKRLADGEGGEWTLPRPDAAWAGGATDGEFAAVGQDLRGLGGTLAARKAWFFLDDCVVCLGAGITCADGVPVETVVDNRNLGARGSAFVRVDGEPAGAAPGRPARRPGVSWAHVMGHAGYVFLSPADLNFLLEERTGSWRDVNAGGSPAPITRRYLTMWLDHGPDPAGASYAYALMPGANVETTRARAVDGRVEVLANTAAVQAIRVPELGLTAANFWAPGRAGGISVSAPACVLVRERSDGTALLCVSDPPRQAAALAVTWEHPVRAVVSAPPVVTATTTGRSLGLTFADLRGTAGATQSITVALAPPGIE
ncbi:polysaccharide lyase 8 family protein [Nonomuraea sp. KM90]|uniref:polysaccharide lyase 8 family protein n=1 Tax=Nonomuraea sp. KM90 TaxID=3457428 RepID=UPI003FCD1B12